jgi:predicted CXXCH cytochrome family protein
MKRLIFFFSILYAFVILLNGCASDPLVEHKIRTNFLDGVPALPPLAQLCEDNMADIFNVYYEERLLEASSGALEEQKIEITGSSHPPYAEKNCQGCHDFKNKNLLLAPADELCEMCHVGFVDGKGENIHGPVAVRDCLACHLPHSSKYKSLLKANLSGICDTCHQEQRLAVNMHNAVTEHKMDCVNCHDAHGGDVTYFLK